jgi:PAS domain S-box-containing protein
MDDLHTRGLSDVSDQPLEYVRQWLAAIVDSSDDAIISKNLDGVITTWNNAAQRLFGYPADEAVGQPITIIIPLELHHEEKDILRRLRAGERIERLETRRITRDGRHLDVSITISPVRDAAGRIIGASKILRDVTERKNLMALLDSEHRLSSEVAGARALQSISTRLISESTQESLFAQILDAAIELMGADAASVQMFAPDEQSLVLLGSRNFHPDSAVFWQHVTTDAGSTCARALRSGERVLVSDVERSDFMTGTRDLDEYRRSGIRAVQSTPLRSRSGQPLGMISTHWRTPHTPTEDDLRLFDVLARQAADLIERARAEHAVREREERFRLIANVAPVTIWMSDTSKSCTYVNQQWIDFTGQPLHAIVGEGWAKGIHHDDVARCWETYVHAFERREAFQMEYRMRRYDGEYRWVISRGVPRYDGDGSFAGYIGSVIDITERKLAEEALSTVSQRLLEAQEEERAHIARELHDDVNQRLSMLGMRLGVLADDEPVLTADVRQKIADAHHEIVGLVGDLQALSHGLHPSRLEFLGIADASSAMCLEMSRQHKVEIGFEAEHVPEGLPRRIAMCLYRVLQEALQNAVRHSGTKKVHVRLRGGRDQIELRVDDVGAGFDLAAAHGRGLGLTSMRERLKAVDGQLEIRSQPDRGTSIHARVPLVQR